MVPIVLYNFIDLECNFSRETNWIDIQDVEDHANEFALRTSSWKILSRGAAVSESQDHLPVLQVAQEESEKPLREP